MEDSDSGAIARTLLSNPKLLVMDEATSALDYESERKVCENLLTITIALSSLSPLSVNHLPQTHRDAHEGAVVEVGTHDDLISRRGRYYALY